jgi:hypothetical protein
MSIIYTETLSDAESRTEIDIGDGRIMTVNITGEGIVIDVYGRAPQEFSDDTLLGTMGMMFDEWADEVVSFDSPTKLEATA